MSIEESFFDDLDRGFLILSEEIPNGSLIWKGVCRVKGSFSPEQLENTILIVKEVAIRTFLVLGTLIGAISATTQTAIVLGVLCFGSHILKAAAYLFQHNHFTHIRGKADEIAPQAQAKAMTWNLLGKDFYYEGKLIHWSSRLDEIERMIEQNDPDVVVLREVEDALFIEAIQSRLGNRFAHTYTNFGLNATGNHNGLFVFTKYAVKNVIAQGFFTCFEFDGLRVIAAELAEGHGMQQKRLEQMDQIHRFLQKQKTPLPTLFMGSLSVSQNSEEGKALLRGLALCYRGPLAPDTKNAILMFHHRIPGKGNLPSVVEHGLQLIDSQPIDGLDSGAAGIANHAVITTLKGLKK